jgi:hypothetical protein
MVLQGQGSCQHVEQMFRGVPREVLSAEQNQCITQKDIKFSVDRHGVNS